MPTKEYYWKNRDKCLEKSKEHNKTPQRQASKKKYRLTEKGIKSNTICCWKRRGVICDFDSIYDIYINTHKCDHCKKKIESSYDRCLDHCHTCGTVRAILCNTCNKCDRVKCYLC